MSTEVEVIEFTQLVEDIQIPCDWDRLFKCGPRGATWLVGLRCGCGQADQRLVCDGCKSVALQMEEGLYCPVDCGEVFIPARRAIHYMEAL
ncbi:MAG: hypothetical protein ACXVGN_00235 [Mycobacteriaceae bacterium]